MRVRIIGQHPEYRSGQEVDLPNPKALDLLRSGQAEPVAVKPSERAETR